MPVQEQRSLGVAQWGAHSAEISALKLMWPRGCWLSLKPAMGALAPAQWVKLKLTKYHSSHLWVCAQAHA